MKKILFVPMANDKQNILKESTTAVCVTTIAIVIMQGLAYITSIQTKNNNFMRNISIFILMVQWIVFLHASGIFGNKRTEKYFDITGSVTYLMTLGIAYFRIPKPSTRQKILTIFASLWSLRLGWFLYSRIVKNNGEDRRFLELKENIFKFFQIWTIQGVWVYTTILAVLYVNQTDDHKDLNFGNFIGIFLWIFGFLFETVSDFQKRQFKENTANNDLWISTGLWSLSRHPNYFGEIVLWLGISLISIQNYKSPRKILISLISPVFVAFLLIFVSGIPMLERHADQKFGHIEDYKKYKASTPVLIPILGRKGDAKF